MQTTSLRIPIDVKSMAQMMNMSEFEVRYSPYMEDLRRAIKDYNYGMYTKISFIEKLETIVKECKQNNDDMYAEGIKSLITKIQFKY